MKLISYESLTATPWKNGGGVTRELACYPAGATMDDFIWRVSLADVAQSGPFSSFPGIDRIITLLDGDGMQLQFADGRQHDLVQVLTPFAFRGEDKLHAELAGTPSRDFNLMLRRDAAQGTVEVRRASGRVATGASTMLLFCSAGQWKIGDVDLHVGDALVLEQTPSDTSLNAIAANSALLCLSITLT